MQILSISDAREMLIFMADRFIESMPYLIEIESKTGDGDHGTGLARGMLKTKAKIETMRDTTDIFELFTETGKSLLMNIGGVSGVLFGSLFLAGAQNAKPKKQLTAFEFSSMMRKGLSAIQLHGEAELGDKTMVDALYPAVQAMETAAAEGFCVMLKMAADAAWQGMEDTKNYIAKFGRAKSMTERAIGYQDAGATSIWIILRSMSAYFNQ